MRTGRSRRTAAASSSGLQPHHETRTMTATRSANCHDHRLQTPDTFVRAPLPGMRQATAIVHASPAGGARFVHYTAEFEAGGALAASGDQRFVYVLGGSLAVGPTKLS